MSSILKVNTIQAHTATDVEVADDLNVTGTLSVGDVNLAGSLGSSLVGFTASGSGAVAASVQSRLRLSINIMDFIPASEWAGIEAYTCTTDLRSYILSALTAADGRKLVCPAGVFPHAGTIPLGANGTYISGERQNTIFRQQTAGSDSFVNANSARRFGYILENIYIDVASGVSGGQAIDFQDVNDSALYNVVVERNGSDGFLEGIVFESTSGKGSFRNTLYNPQVRTRANASAIALKLTGVSGNGSNANRVFGGNIFAESGNSIYIFGTTNQINGVTIEGTHTTAISVANDGGGSDGNIITGCHIEGTITTGILFDASTNSSLAYGNTFSSGVSSPVTDNGDNTVFRIYAADRTFAFSPLRAFPVATASLPTAATAQDGKMFIETITSPTGLNFSAYANGVRVRMLPPSGRPRFSTVPVGSVAYGSFGTSTTPTAGSLYWAEVFIDRPITLTGIAPLNAATVGTNKYVVALYDSTGAVLATSDLAGTTTSGADAFQQIPFTATEDITQPGRYWIGLQLDGNTDRFRTIAASTFIDVFTKSSAAVFGTITNFTPPTVFTANVGPIAYVY